MFIYKIEYWVGKKTRKKNALELAIKNISKPCSDNSDLKCQTLNINVIWNKTKSKKMGLWSLQSKIFRSYALITLTCSVKFLTQNCYHIALTLSFLSLALFTALAKFRVFDAFEYQVVQKLQRTPFKSFCIFWIFAHFFSFSNRQNITAYEQVNENDFFLQTKGVVLRSQITLHSV